MTTLRREIKIKIQQILEENGIYTDALPGQPSIVDLLTDGVIGVAGITSAAQRFGLKPVGMNAQEMAKKRLALGERIEAQLLVTVDHNNKAWTRVLNRIIEAEANGESFDKYVKWYKAGTEYNRPKTFQIYKNPALIWGNWKEAQAYCDQEMKAL